MALRIDALPFDVAKAVFSSELGFVLSSLRMEVVVNGKASEVNLGTAFDDDPDAFYPAEATLKEAAEKLLANTVIENFRVDVQPQG